MGVSLLGFEGTSLFGFQKRNRFDLEEWEEDVPGIIDNREAGVKFSIFFSNKIRIYYEKMRKRIRWEKNSPSPVQRVHRFAGSF